MKTDSSISDWCDQAMKPSGTFFIPKQSPAQEALMKRLLSSEKPILVSRMRPRKNYWINTQGFHEYSALMEKLTAREVVVPPAFLTSNQPAP